MNPRRRRHQRIRRMLRRHPERASLVLKRKPTIEERMTANLIARFDSKNPAHLAEIRATLEKARNATKTVRDAVGPVKRVAAVVRAAVERRPSTKLPVQTKEGGRRRST